MQQKPIKNPGIAAVLSFIIPGLGQIYCERIGRGIVWLIGAILGYFAFVVPGVIVAILATFDALRLAKAMNEGKVDYGLRENLWRNKKWYIGICIFLAIIALEVFYIYRGW